jgi:hypothetical protein
MQRLRSAEWLLGAAGLLLFLSLFMPWYEVVDGTVDGWRSLGLIDVWLFLTAILAIATVVVTATREAPALPLTFEVLTAWASLFGVLMVLYRVISEANAEVVTGRSWGLFVALLAIVGTFAGAWRAMRDQSQPGLRPPPEVRAMPVPPEHDPTTPAA